MALFAREEDKAHCVMYSTEILFVAMGSFQIINLTKYNATLASFSDLTATVGIIHEVSSRQHSVAFHFVPSHKYKSIFGQMLIAIKNHLQ